MASEDLWHGSFAKIKEKLRLCISVCERWAGVCEQLTTHFWKRYSPHPWSGGAFLPPAVGSLNTRLSEVS